MYSVSIKFYFSLLLFSLESLGAFEPLIHGGEKASENQFPFIASLRLNIANEQIHFCGLSILSDRVLITAAHCYDPMSPKYHVAIGVHKREDQGELYAVQKFIVHPNFTEYPFELLNNDIALVLLERPIQFSVNISAIKIGRDFIGGGVAVETAGWGESEDGYSGLKYAKLTTLTNDECREKTPAKAPVRDFGSLCAYSGTAGTGLCNGDSGGPLFSGNTLIGINSWAKPCAKGIPDGFTRVSEYAMWIDQVIQREMQYF